MEEVRVRELWTLRGGRGGERWRGRQRHNRGRTAVDDKKAGQREKQRERERRGGVSQRAGGRRRG